MADFTRLNRSNGEIVIVLLLLLAGLPPKAVCLRCNACKSSESWGKCDTNVTEKECTMEEARCVKYHYHMTDDKTATQQVQLFERDCVSQAQCSSSQLPACKDLEKTGTKIKLTCHVSCCGEDLCNSQVTTSASVLIVMVVFFSLYLF